MMSSRYALIAIISCPFARRRYCARVSRSACGSTSTMPFRLRVNASVGERAEKGDTGEKGERWVAAVRSGGKAALRIASAPTVFDRTIR